MLPRVVCACSLNRCQMKGGSLACMSSQRVLLVSDVVILETRRGRKGQPQDCQRFPGGVFQKCLPAGLSLDLHATVTTVT